MAAALALLAVTGPFMAFPELLPEPVRVIGISITAAAYLILTVVLLPDWRRPGAGLPIFIMALALGWVLLPEHDTPGTRHFAGVALGLLAMAAVAGFCTSLERLTFGAGVIVFGAIAVLLVGLAGTYFGWSGQKMVVGTTEAVQTLNYPWIPHVQLGLPGLEPGVGWVNANALGGTALMLLPVCAGVFWAARYAPRGRVALAGLAVAAAVVAAAIIWMSRSRTSIVAVGIVACALALHWRAGRKWLIVAVLSLALFVAWGANRTRRMAPENFAKGIELTRGNLHARWLIWHDALDVLRVSPVLGAGINQFHASDRIGELIGQTYVAHAHNVVIQVALDTGLLGLTGYLLLFWKLLMTARRTAMHARSRLVAGVAAGAGLSVLAVHLFGISDAIALGAKVGLFQWLCAGLIVATARISAAAPDDIR